MTETFFATPQGQVLSRQRLATRRNRVWRGAEAIPAANSIFPWQAFLGILVHCGEVAERSKAAVLKTVDPSGSVGSNPTLSGKSCARFVDMLGNRRGTGKLFPACPVRFPRKPAGGLRGAGDGACVSLRPRSGEYVPV